MKKRNLLFGCLIPALALTLSACDLLPENVLNKLKKSSSEPETSSRVRPSRTQSSSEHTHKFSEEWSYNNLNHWHDSVCGHSVRSDVGEHEFYSAVVKEPTCQSPGEQVDICVVCDYRRTHSIPAIDHSWYEYSRVEPTCYESGYSRRYCTICGISEEEYLYPLGHDYVPISYQESTCKEGGHVVEQCTRCGEIVEYDLATSEHRWSGNEVYNEGYNNNVSYTTDTCLFCGATKIRINAMDIKEGSLNGSLKTGEASNYGYVKLASNGSSISYTFDYPTNAYGTIYQHSVFDQNPGNFGSYNYRTGNSTTGYNFSLAVNSMEVDLSQASNISYGEFLDNGEEIPGVSYNGYSLAADCIIGEVALNQGINTITYTRTGSYNLWFDSLILVVQNSSHTHSVSNYWDSDDNAHWHVCEDPNCPVANARIDYTNHVYGERYEVSPVTCHSDGIEREVCAVCGYQHDIIIPAIDHEYQAVGLFEKVDNSVYLEEYGCAYCDQYALRWNALEYDRDESRYFDDTGSYVRFQSGMAENSGGTPQDGSHIVYKVYSPVDQYNVGLAFYMSQSTGSASRVFASTGASGYIYDQYGNLVQSTSKYGLRVNGTEVYLGEDNYNYVNNSGTNWYNWPVSFNLYAGINTIDIYCLDYNYRARVYNYQITGISYIEPNHVHTPSSNLEWDSYYHYNPCTNGDGVRFNEEPHTFTDYEIISNQTCSEYGEQMRTCTVCGYVEYSSIYPNGHNFADYYWIQEPTCTQEGIQEHVCMTCGYVEQSYISTYDHSWDEGVVISNPTHNEAGQKLYTCLACGETKIESIPAGHNWSEYNYVQTPYEGCVSYNTRSCSDDNAVEIDINALDGNFSGDYKMMSSNSANYVRLNSNGYCVNYDFYYGQHAIGMLYLRGFTTSYSSYQNQPFLNSGSSPSGYNFDVLVNGMSMDLSAISGKSFYDVFNEGQVDPSLSTAYSPVANVPIGYVELNPGINSITYYRYGSYNIYMSDIILVVEPTDHVHTAEGGFACDNEYHWHYCSDPNCPTPNMPIDREYHNFVPMDYVDYSCYSNNYTYYVCTICGYQMSISGYAEHQFNEEGYWAINSDGYSISYNTCSVCQKTVEAIDMSYALINGSYSGGKLSAGTTLTFRMPVFQTGYVSIYLPCRMSSGNTNQTFDPSLYNIVVSGTSCDILMPYGTYNEIGITDQDTRYFKFAEYYVTQNDLNRGEIEINFTSNVSSYRMIIQGELRLEY